MKYTVWQMLLLSGTLFAEQLPLPNALSSRAIYYQRTKQLDDFSCVYNVLFNAVNFEQCCGFPNPMHKYELFECTIRPYIQKERLNPKKASYNKDTEYLARVLGLKHFYHLQRDAKTYQVHLLLTEKTSITYPRGTSEAEVERRLAQASLQKKEKVMQAIVHHLESTDNAVVHFLCYLKSFRGEPHAMLISLHQNSTGRGLYLFDNLNKEFDTSHEVMYFIERLFKTFGISSAQQFKGPQLPHRWPHLDRPDRSIFRTRAG